MSAAAVGTVALVGRPNAGKSSLFNRLTGADAKVGNFPGVTVDVLEAEVTDARGRTWAVVDLPGLYTLGVSASGDTDEGVARQWLDRAVQDRRPVALLQVLDGTQLGLGLRLTQELLREPFPLAVVVTQEDLLRRDGATVDTARLEEALGVPVRAVSARDPGSRAAVLGLLEGSLVPSAERVERPERDWDPERLARQCYRREGAGAASLARRTERLDRVLLHPVAGPVLFTGLMVSLFAAVFLVADPASAALEAGVGRLSRLVSRAVTDPTLASFLVDGVLGGAGTVLAFLPQIVILTVALELMDASGYLSRGVFLVDRLLRAAGLGGRSFVPLLTAHACAVPAIQATRILRDGRERLRTLLVLPLMTCSARIPTYALLLAAFFSHRGVWFRGAAFVGLYLAGACAGLLASLVLRRTVARGRSLPLVVEMPAYRSPEPRVVWRVTTRAAVGFLRDVGTSILAVSVVLWALLTIPAPWGAPPRAEAAPIERSVAASVGRALEPVTRYAGFDWRINVGLLGAFGAREVMVGTLGVIYGIEGAEEDPAPLATRLRDARTPDGRPLHGPATALSLMAFFVLACQCMSTVAALRRETRGWRWPLFVVGYTYALASGAAVLVFQVASRVLR
ncbi:MAG: ferrous iron transporter B [Deltaproteobacteria bacterium]|nr:ferrous iron transporter B [Deltaproteobacteria bacterium]